MVEPKGIDTSQGDCFALLKTIPKNSVQLIYLDPPFLTQKKHSLRSRDGSQEFAFEDVWGSVAEYQHFLGERLQEMHRVLKAEGSLFFHCDKNATHLARSLLDEIFGEKQFRSEIIWHYRRWSNSKKGLLPAHQTIYYYSKSEHYLFNLQWQDYSLATNVEQLLQKRERNTQGKIVYKRDSEGNVISNGRKKGVPLSDVWDIPYLNPKAKERTGYPTQKPLLLLKRIIQIATKEGQQVLDPFCGSGTTLVAAHMLNRCAIGFDISAQAIALTRTRLKNPVQSNSELLQKGRESYRQSESFLLALLQGLDFVPIQRNKGIDALMKEDFEGTPVPIRVQRKEESIKEAAEKLYQAAKNKNALKMFLVVFTEEKVELPLEISLIPAPALRIQQALKERNS